MAEVLLEAVEEVSRSEKQEPLTAADKLDDFEAVVCLDCSFLPPGSRENIQIALDSHSITLHAEVIEQRDDVQIFGNFAALAVDRDRH